MRLPVAAVQYWESAERCTGFSEYGSGGLHVCGLKVVGELGAELSKATSATVHPSTFFNTPILDGFIHFLVALALRGQVAL